MYEGIVCVIWMGCIAVLSGLMYGPLAHTRLCPLVDQEGEVWISYQDHVVTHSHYLWPQISKQKKEAFLTKGWLLLSVL